MAVKDQRPSRLASPSCAFAAHWMVAAAILVLQSSCLNPSRAQQQRFIPPNNGTCACLNQNLAYTCVVDGPGATVWSGTSFACPTQDRMEVTLRHSGFNDGSAFGICNDGSVIAQALNVTANRYYTSELIVNITNGLNGSSVSCLVSSGGRMTVGSEQIIVITGPYQQVPNIAIAEISANRLGFIWNSVDPTCSAISYDMTTSGCGSCSITTNVTTAMSTCTGLQLGNVCNFTVQSAICGFIGMPSNTASLAIKVPDPPQVTIIPVYSANMNDLTRLSINVSQQGTDTVTDPPITEYNISYSGGVQQRTPCTDGRCEYELSGPFQECDTSTSSISNVAVSVSNAFGQGDASMPQSFGCTNQFVRVNYTLSVITCTFLNMMDTSVKSCIVMYGSCDQELEKRRTSGNSTVDRPNYIEVQLEPSITSLDCFMYSVTASNDTYTVIVEDTRNTQRGTLSQVVAIAVVVPIIIVVVAIIVVIIIILVITVRRKLPPTHQSQSQSLNMSEGLHNPVQLYAENTEYLAIAHPYLCTQGKDVSEGATEENETKAP